jgi:hypothetical protein
MKLSKKEKQLCIDKWQWFYDHPSEKIKDLPKKLRVEDNDNDCILCKKLDVNDYRDIHKCVKCSVYKYDNIDCWDDNSIFQKWNQSKTSYTNKKYSGILLEIMKQL